MPKANASTPSNWLTLITSLPAADPALRMRVLRTLEALGAAVIREGVYLLPHTPETRKSLDRLAGYVTQSAGIAQVLAVTALGPEQQDAFQLLFDRTARYATLTKTIESLSVGFGVSEPGAIARVLHKQRREFENIAALDFFPNQARDRAREALERAEKAVREHLFPTRPGATQSAVPGAADAVLGRTWITYRPLWADRLASSWLIRRFVDPEATVRWLDKGERAPSGALGFGFSGAHYANSATHVTFEELVERFSLVQDKALARIGAIVRHLEVGGAAVPEASGVETLLHGALRRAPGDADLLHETEKTFDLLYEAYLDGAR